VQFVPGLLQNDAYARAVILLSHEAEDPEEIDRRVGLRMARKRLLTRPEAPQLWAVIDEAVLRRPMGGAEVMRDQIEALIKASDLPNVRLQVMPFAPVGARPRAGRSPSCASPTRTFPTWSTSNISPAPCTSTSVRRSTGTSRPSGSCSSTPNR